MKAKIVCLLAVVCGALLVSSFSNRTTVTSTLTQLNPDGTTEIIEPIEKENWISEKEMELTELLMEQDYLDVPIVVITQSEADPSRYIYYISLLGDDLVSRYDEIYALVAQCLDLEQFDLENSLIYDMYGKSINPADQASSPETDGPSQNCSQTILSVYGEQESAAIAKIGQLLSDDNFGGLYYNDEGNLVVNVVDTNNIPKTLSEDESITNNVTFQEVSYSLAALEAVCDSLVPHMDTLKIMALDANDVTNKVDVCLSDFSDQNKAQILALIDTELVSRDAINFIDDSDTIITFGVE